MTQEDKELLLKELCARLPYEVKLLHVPTNEITTLESVGKYFVDGDIHDSIENFKPYLFPLSSMTEEQKKELENLGWYFDNFEIHNVRECLGTYREFVAHSDCFNLIDWLNKNHFDYRSLIEKGLANDATGLNIY